MAEVYSQILKHGLQASYDALQTKDANVLYFCTDTQKIYKGDVDFSNNIIVAATKPATPVAGKVYVLADTDTVEVYVNGAWKVVSYPTVTSIDVNSDDKHVATAKAIYDAIQDAIADLAGSADTVKAIGAGTTDGFIEVTKGDDSKAEFSVPGVVTTPTWDATARKLTLPVTGGTTVEVNIGKDIFVDSTADNKYNPETGNIEIYLNDGEGGEPTMISVPASALVDVYEGDDTNSAKVTVGEDNVIKVDVVVDPVEGNALVLTETGLKVDLSAYAKSADVQDQIDAVSEVANAADTLSKANQTAIGILNGDASTEGSVDYKVAAAKSVIDTNISDLTKQVETNTANIATNTENIAALAAATTQWGTF